MLVPQDDTRAVEDTPDRRIKLARDPGFVCQTGVNTLAMSSVVISFTSFAHRGAAVSRTEMPGPLIPGLRVRRSRLGVIDHQGGDLRERGNGPPRPLCCLPGLEWIDTAPRLDQRMDSGGLGASVCEAHGRIAPQPDHAALRVHLEAQKPCLPGTATYSAWPPVEALRLRDDQSWPPSTPLSVISGCRLPNWPA